MTDVWTKENRGNSALQIWQCKVRALHQYLGGWAKNISGTHKKEKIELNVLIDKLDKKAEFGRLFDEELTLKKIANERLAQLLREEEVKWYQKSKVNFFWREIEILIFTT